MTVRVRREEGIALIVTMLAIFLMAALGATLVVTTSSEVMIAANFRNAVEGGYAADAALERVLDDVFTVADWNTILSGSVRSAFVDGAPNGVRKLADSTTVDLAQVVNQANCGKSSPCSDADMDESTSGRPWGTNNPRWQLFAYGSLSHMVPVGAIDSSFYVTVMIADDPSENDKRPLQDGLVPCGEAMPSGEPPSCNPGAGVLSLRAESFGPRGAHKIIEMTVSRTPKAFNHGVEQAGVRVVSWREVR